MPTVRKPRVIRQEKQDVNGNSPWPPLCRYIVCSKRSLCHLPTDYFKSSLCPSTTIVSSFQPPMFRKFSKSSAPSKPPTSEAQPISYQPSQPWPRQRLQTASDSNLPASRRNDKANSTLAPKPGGIIKETRPRRSTISSSGPSQRPAVSFPKSLPAVRRPIH